MSLPRPEYRPPVPVWPVRHEARAFRPGWFTRGCVDQHGRRLQVTLRTDVAAFLPEQDVLSAATTALERSMPVKPRSDRADLDARMA